MIHSYTYIQSVSHLDRSKYVSFSHRPEAQKKKNRATLRKNLFPSHLLTKKYRQQNILHVYTWTNCGSQSVIR